MLLCCGSVLVERFGAGVAAGLCAARVDEAAVEQMQGFASLQEQACTAFQLVTEPL